MTAHAAVRSHARADVRASVAGDEPTLRVVALETSTYVPEPIAMSWAREHGP